MFTIKTKSDGGGFGSMSTIAGTTGEALQVANDMLERGADAVEIVGRDGTTYDLAELERLIGAGEAMGPVPASGRQDEALTGPPASRS